MCVRARFIYRAQNAIYRYVYHVLSQWRALDAVGATVVFNHTNMRTQEKKQNKIIKRLLTQACNLERVMNWKLELNNGNSGGTTHHATTTTWKWKEEKLWDRDRWRIIYIIAANINRSHWPDIRFDSPRLSSFVELISASIPLSLCQRPPRCISSQCSVSWFNFYFYSHLFHLMVSSLLLLFISRKYIVIIMLCTLQRVSCVCAANLILIHALIVNQAIIIIWKRRRRRCVFSLLFQTPIKNEKFVLNRIALIKWIE